MAVLGAGELEDAGEAAVVGSAGDKLLAEEEDEDAVVADRKVIGRVDHNGRVSGTGSLDAVGNGVGARVGVGSTVLGDDGGDRAVGVVSADVVVVLEIKVDLDEGRHNDGSRLFRHGRRNLQRKKGGRGKARQR